MKPVGADFRPRALPGPVHWGLAGLLAVAAGLSLGWAWLQHTRLDALRQALAVAAAAHEAHEAARQPPAPATLPYDGSARELLRELAWMDRGINFRIMGEKNFRTLSTKAAILIKLNRIDEAKKVMEEALPLGSMQDIHQYARTLLSAKQTQEAFKIYKSNYDKYPNEFTTNVGMGRAYSAQGDYKKALNYMKVALPKAPNNFYKNVVETMIKTLEQGKDIN